MIRFLMYLYYVRYSFLYITLLLGINILLSVGILFIPATNKILYDKLFITFDGYLLLKYLLITIFLLAYNVFLSFIFSIVNSMVLYKIGNKLKVNFLKRLFDTKYSFFVNNDTGFLVKRLVEDTGSVSNGISNVIIGLCNIIKIIVIGFVLATLGDWLLKMYMILLAVSFLWTFLWSIPCVAVGNMIGKDYSDLYSYYWEVIPGIKAVKLYNYHNFVLERLNKIQLKLNIHNMFNSLLNSIIWQVSNIFPWISYGIILYFGIQKVEQGDLTVGALFGLFSMIWVFFDPLQSLNGNIGAIQAAISAAIRTKMVHGAPKEIHGKKHFSKLQHSIVFKDVSFSYDGEKKILNNFNLLISKNEKVNFRGRSGSGKTTIAHLLLRLFDSYKGQILIDGIELRNYNIHSLRKNIGFISQDVYLFNESIRKNIDLNGLMSDDEILNLLNELDMKERVLSLKNGLDSKFGEDGLDFSGGERQRISIARCLALNTSVIITDEITSALDPKTDRKVKEYFRKISENVTLIAINHRESFEGEYDRDVVIGS